MSKEKVITLILRIIPALILLQTLFFKFTSAPESVYIFTQIGIEPWGRYLSGIGELVAGILLLSPLYFYGAILSLVIIIPAILVHLTSIGIVVQNDSGLLFGMVIIVLICSIILIKRHKSK